MKKYIDPEKLIAEIQKRIEETKSMKPSFDQFWAGQISAFKGCLNFIDSLQQEQPKINIPSAGSGAMGTPPPKFKLDVKQDLPVVLEKEIKEYLEKLGGGHGGFVDDLTDDDLTGFARHFYELGINARKED